MKTSISGGFTIIETLLFLAISAMLVLIVSVGRGEQTKRTQFTDSVDSLMSKLTRLQAERNSTVSASSGIPNPDVIDFMTEVSFTDDSPEVRVRTCTTDRDDGPIIVPPSCTDKETFKLKWGAYFDYNYSSCTPLPAAVLPADGILFLRHHQTGLLRTLGLNAFAGGDVAQTLTNEYSFNETQRVIWLRRADGGQCAAILINDDGRINQLERRAR